MKIFAVNGSPRKQGSTAAVINEMVRMALDAGHHVDRHDVYDLNISGCRGCMGCKHGDSCVIDDDMTQIYLEMKEADIIILGSPIYMGAETGPFKMFIDRTYALLDFSKDKGKK